jgi:Ran GTPase-activating protein (RanGAP) involved in mRNA processing and transport
MNSVQHIAEKIEQTKGLEVLDLGGNSIGVEAGERLATALQSQSNLKVS